MKEVKMYTHIFETITDDNTAYWLGFLTADGSVNTKRLQIGLANKDKEHLEKFKTFLNTNAQITERYMGCQNGKKYLTNFIEINSIDLIKDLAKYSIVPRKTYLDVDFLSFIDEPYKFSYICGYLDGDGWIACSNKSVNFGFCGNHKTMVSISEYLNQKYDYHFSISQYKKSPTTYYFQTWTYKILQQFLTDYCELYGKCDLLERKYEKAITVLEILYFKSHISSSLRQYKSRTIKPEEPKELPIIICPICGIEFHPLYLNQKYCSQKCSHIEQQRTDRPDRNTLKSEIRSTPFLQLGLKYSVSDNAIRKWCKSYGLPYQTAVIKKMTDEEWEKA